MPPPSFSSLTHFNFILDLSAQIPRDFSLAQEKDWATISKISPHLNPFFFPQIPLFQAMTFLSFNTRGRFWTGTNQNFSSDSSSVPSVAGRGQQVAKLELGAHQFQQGDGLLTHLNRLPTLSVAGTFSYPDLS